MAREGLISEEQFEKLSELENTEIETIATILKDAKIGQGIPFLPTTLTDLRAKFGTLWKEFTKDGKTVIKDKILPVLKELLRRGGITDKQYSTLLKEIDTL